MLAQDHLDYFAPVLLQAFSTDLMRPDIIRSESLHAKIVDKAMVSDAEHISSDLRVADFARDKT